MKYYIIAGETSGDLHGARLAKQIVETDTQAQIRACGGDLLRKAGATVVKDYKDMAFMGFVEVATHLNKIFSNFAFCKKDIIDFQPDVVILIDYPGFNLRLAKFLHKKKIPTFYYISPQIWAWHTSRVKIIKKYVSEMFVILPFEQDFYAKYNYPVHYFGHPLLDIIKNATINNDFLNKNHLDNRPIIAILPGSRRQEILRMLPTMIQVSKQYSDYQFVIAGITQQKNLYEQISNGQNIKIVFNQTYDLLTHSHAAMVTSGTATLETALFGVPQVVCYKANYISYLIAKHLISGIQYISLVNLIANKSIVTELIQNDMNPQLLKTELDSIIANCPKRNDILLEYKQLQNIMGDGNTTKKIAQLMVELLNKKYQKQ